VDALGGTDHAGSGPGHARHLAHAVGPGARRVDDDGGAHREHLVGEEIPHPHAVETAGPLHDFLHLAIVVDARAVAARGQDVFQAHSFRKEEEIVEVIPRPLEILGPDIRLHGKRIHRPQGAVALGDLAGGEKVVEPHADAHQDEAAPAASEYRDQERQRPHQVRRHALQRLPLAERLAHELEVPQLQVAQAAVDELGGLRRGAGGEVALLEERDGDAAKGEVARDARAGHTAPDHDHVERCLVDAREPALDHDVLTTEYLGRIVSRGRERGGGFAGRRAA
jgi:hypothetical protein